MRPKSVGMLRQRAEELLRAKHADIPTMPAVDVQAIVHELNVHQMELEIQNEELRQAQVELADARDRYADLYEFAPVGYVTLDKDGKVLEANLTAATMLGVERQTLLRRNIASFLTRDSQDACYLHQLATFSREMKQTCELEMTNADDARLVLRVESIAFGLEHDRRCRTALVDVTELRVAADALRKLNEDLDQRVFQRTAELAKREHDFRLLADNVPALFSYVDHHLCYCYVNRRYEELFQQPASEVVGKTVAQILGSDRYELVRPHVEAVLRGEEITYDADLEFVDGPHTMHVHYVPDRDASQHVQGFFALVTDITDLARAREQIKSMALFPLENPHPVVRVCRQGIVLHANPASRLLLEQWGCWPDGRLPENWASVVAETLETGLLRHVELAVATQIFSLEFVPIGESDYVNVYAHDVTNRKRAEEALRQSEQRFRFMADAAPVLIWMSGRDKQCTWFNKQWLEFVGRSMEQEIGSGWSENVHRVDFDRCLTTYTTAFDAREPFSMEYRLRRHDGEYRWMLDRGVPLPQGSGEFEGYIGSCIDITERRRAETSLWESEQQLRAILNTAADAIITIDRRGVISDVNSATERMFGYMRDELVGENVRILMPPPFRDEHDGYKARYLQTGEARIIGIGREVVGRRKDGSTFPVGLAVSQVDQLGLFTGIVRDMSEVKAMQKHLLEIASDEQRRIGQELHDGTGQELTALSLFAGTLLDVLNRASLAANGGNAGWLLAESDVIRLKHIATRLSQGLAEANRHVQQLSHGMLPVQIDAEGLRSALAELAAKTDRQRNIACRFQCSGPVAIPNNSTAMHLYRIAQEALNNAIRHSRADKICISLSQEADLLIVEVSDNGVGFDRNVDSSAPTSVGAGMGLRTMEYRAGLLGGVLRIQRNPEGGTTVTCRVSGGGSL